MINKKIAEYALKGYVLLIENEWGYFNEQRISNNRTKQRRISRRRH